jgi:hypothetical protein
MIHQYQIRSMGYTHEYAQRMMDVIRSKVGIYTKQITIPCKRGGKDMDMLVFVTTANPNAVLESANEMLAKTNKRVNKLLWGDIKIIATKCSQGY